MVFDRIKIAVMNGGSMQVLLACVVVLAFLSVLLTLLWRKGTMTADQDKLIFSLSMTLQAMALTVVGFYFGSLGKDQLIAQNQQIVEGGARAQEAASQVSRTIEQATNRMSVLEGRLDPTTPAVPEAEIQQEVAETLRLLENAREGAQSMQNIPLPNPAVTTPVTE